MGLRVYTGGTFDLFHTGHVNLLRQCRELAGDEGLVIVGLNTDEFIEEYKGRPPVMSYADRRAVLYACRYVDLVDPNTGGPDSKPAIKAAHPNLIVIGSDWHERDYMAQLRVNWEWLRTQRIGIAYVPNTEGISTTDIRGRLNG